jgi:hypothetical protein
VDCAERAVMEGEFVERVREALRGHHSDQGQYPGKIANTMNPLERFEFQSTA